MMFIRKIMAHWQRKLLAKVHELNYLFIELTARCNLHCIHCGSDCSKDATTKDLPAAMIISVLKEIKTQYDPKKITVVLTGGEPLCYPGVFDLGRKIMDLQYPWGMVTNGYAWIKEKVSMANNSGMQTVTVSLDGFEPEHDWLRGKRGSFKYALRTIKMLLSDGHHTMMDVVTCVNQRNLKYLDEFYAMLFDLGLTRWRVFCIEPYGRATANPELFLSAEQFKELMEKLILYRKRSQMHIEFSDSGYLGPHYESCVRDAAFFCRAGISVSGIMANGDILACPNIDRSFAQGNIFQDNFLDIWNNKYQPFRNRQWMKSGICETCNHWRQCQGNSFHLRDAKNQNTRLCHIQKFNLPDERS